MAKIRNITDQALHVPLLGRVVDVDEVVEVPDDMYAAHAWPESTWVEVAAPRKSKSDTKDEE